MELHYKCTMWCKLKFDGDVKEEDIIKKLEEGYLPLELGYDSVVPNSNNCEWEIIDDSEEYITPSENNGYATIELMKFQEGELGMQCIWDNSYETQLKEKSEN